MENLLLPGSFMEEWLTGKVSIGNLFLQLGESLVWFKLKKLMIQWLWLHSSNNHFSLWLILVVGTRETRQWKIVKIVNFAIFTKLHLKTTEKLVIFALALRKIVKFVNFMTAFIFEHKLGYYTWNYGKKCKAVLLLFKVFFTLAIK